MCRKLIYLISFIFILTSTAEADLVGLWRFDETSGTIAHDASGNGHDGTLVGDPMWVPGKIGGALDYDGEDDVVELGVFDVIGSGITLAGWIRPKSFTINDGRVITKANEWGENDHWWMLSTISSGAEIRLRFRLKIEGQTTTTLIAGSGPLVTDEWQHATATWDGSTMRLYLNGEEVGSVAKTGAAVATNPDVSVSIGSQPSDAFAPATPDHVAKFFDGLIDDVRLYNEALTAERLQGIMEGEGYPFAFSPDPADGAIHEDTWVNLSWSPGDFAVTHDVYLGDNPDDINEATQESDVFRGNQDLTFYVAGFPGYAFPDGLVPGTTYYWRIDEVNDSEPNSPWKGDVWSFMVPPKTAYYPDPVNGAELVPENATLTWTAGFGAKLHTVYFGEDFDTVNDAAGGAPMGVANYTPGALNLAKTYYWRVDEFDGAGTYKGDVWSFTTEGAVSGANPANGAVDVNPTQSLTWDAGAIAASHEVYFGSDADAVKNATKASPEYKGARALGEESYDPGKLTLNTAYFWRIDEINDVNPDSPWAGNVWSFTTGDFFVIDDFEDYDIGENEIWWTWKDGLGYVAHNNEPAYPGNGTGSAVGDETSPSYMEETIVHGGYKSMPIGYDNNKQGYAYYSETELTLTVQRNWAEEGVMELSIWFRGEPDNDPEPLYVAVSNRVGAPAVVVQTDTNAATIDNWTEWVIPLSAFTKQGINLSDVDKIAIGLGTQGNITTPGGSGKMFFDDIQLCRPAI